MPDYDGTGTLMGERVIERGNGSCTKNQRPCVPDVGCICECEKNDTG